MGRAEWSALWRVEVPEATMARRDEVLKAVPLAQREGAYALGATRFEAIRAVCPAQMCHRLLHQENRLSAATRTPVSSSTSL